MAKKKATKEEDSVQNNSLMGMAEMQNRRCGPGTVFWGTGLKRDPSRLPTGVFPLDFASAGGLPVWGTTCFWGPDKGGKSSLAINAMRSTHSTCWRCFRPLEFCTCSQKPLEMRAYVGDVEGTLDRDWAAYIGADPEKYLVGLADYGQQHINIAESALRADDCGLVILDSLGALTPMEEIEGVMEDQFIGLQPRMITRMVRVLKQRLIRERKRGHPCAVVFVNQLRIKIGVMFGDPETMPGGKGLQHEFSLLFRCISKVLKKDGVDKKYVGKPGQTSAVRHSFSIRREKVLTLSGVGEYVRIREPMPALGLEKGMVDDFGTVMIHAKEHGVVEKKGNSWRCFPDYKASNLESLKTFWKKNRAAYMLVQQEIIKRAKARLAAE